MWCTSNFDDIREPLLNILTNAPSNSFVAFDIDETLIHEDKPVPEGMFIHDLVIISGIPVIYVTARVDTDVVRQKTLQELSRFNIFPEKIMFRPVDVETWPAISAFKYNVRAQHEAGSNSVCVLNIGDQWTDMMPLTMESWTSLRRVYADKHVLYETRTDVDGVLRWHMKLKE